MPLFYAHYLYELVLVSASKTKNNLNKIEVYFSLTLMWETKGQYGVFMIINNPDSSCILLHNFQLQVSTSWIKISTVVLAITGCFNDLLSLFLFLLGRIWT